MKRRTALGIAAAALGALVSRKTYAQIAGRIDDEGYVEIALANTKCTTMHYLLWEREW
jgi:hypothetical protein